MQDAFCEHVIASSNQLSNWAAYEAALALQSRRVVVMDCCFSCAEAGSKACEGRL